ncbi:uncharacterized protein LOC104584747 [Brachypodium distachyon]|uniref:No apical meristem-associated C-terminal domain-containing protein n=1 Tax=Brachypodium distachyon TaxID=15368 RepID=A0A2K2CTC6_BRADI|nr:uncharacterized protein LOC104584747 [Brachypodium distachyon]PNT65279.1 hypothetical protein BRADI_4g39576v3 [Brachypodium distachyon]|eukprot:XP_010238581.1 uncharacterized protein LOC104584747 [Brachypodium distachyon]
MDGALGSCASSAVHAGAAVAGKKTKSIPKLESLKRKERRHRAAELKRSQEDAAARALAGVAATVEEDALAAEAARNQQLAAQQDLLLHNRQAVADAFVQQAASVTIGLQESLKEMISVKEASSGKRGEIRELKKDDLLKSFMDTIQEKYRGDAAVAAEKLRIEADMAAAALLDATSRAKEVELKVLVEESRIMTMDLSTLDDVSRAWFIKKKKKIADRQD